MFVKFYLTPVLLFVPLVLLFVPLNVSAQLFEPPIDNLFSRLTSESGINFIKDDSKNPESPSVCVAPPANLVSWYRGENNANDAQGTNNGTLNGGADFAPGKVGSGVRFNAPNEYLLVPASPGLDVGAGGSLTLEAWVNPISPNSGGSGHGPIFEWGNGSGVQLGRFNNGQLFANVVDAGPNNHFIFTPDNTLTTNQFQHVALTYTNATGIGIIYVNGVAVATLNLGIFTPRTNSEMRLGLRGSDDSFNGIIDEATIYNRALSQTEIQAIVNAGSAGKCDAPLRISPIIANVAAGDGGFFVFGGGGSQTYINNGGANPKGAWTINKTGGTVTAATSLILLTGQPLNITSGTLYLSSNSNLRAGALTIAANGRLVNDSSTTITLGGNLMNDGTIDLQGGGSNCPQTDTILIRSSSGVQRTWTGGGRYRLVDVDVQDMGGTGTKTVFSGTNSGGNNASWVFNSGCPTALSIAPLSANVQTGATQTFTGNGGFPNYTFSISINNSGATINPTTGVYTAGATAGVTDTVRVTDVFGSTREATVNVSVAVNRLAFVVQPSNTNGGGLIFPFVQVAIQDAGGNTITTATNAITIAVGNNPNNGTLFGTLTQNAVNGIAVFNNVGIIIGGDGYTLTAASGSLTGATSNPFNVVSPFIVKNTNGGGFGSFGNAISYSNFVAGTQVISFNIGGTAPFSILVVSGLPEIAQPVVIDGTTQPGYAGSPLIEIHPFFLGDRPHGLKITGGNSTVKGLVINRFLRAIEINGGGGNIIQGNSTKQGITFGKQLNLVKFRDDKNRIYRRANKGVALS